jgi:hypothetical protein
MAEEGLKASERNPFFRRDPLFLREVPFFREADFFLRLVAIILRV